VSLNKKIVQILYSGLGGHGTVAFTLFEGFKIYNFENYFIFYGIEQINNEYLQKVTTDYDVKGYKFIQKKTKTGLKEWASFYNYLKKIKPNTIILHSPQLILPSFLFKIFHNTKIITVEHDSIAVRTKIKWLISNINALLADKIIVLTKDYKNHTETHLWFKSLIKKYVIIPNSVNTNLFKPKLYYFSNTKIIIFMASRMNILRDHQTLINAIKPLQNKYNIELRIAGNGETLTPLRNKNEDENIIFLGNINQQKIIEELHNADIYIHATFAETFSTAILQAMSCSLPIICSDIEGTRHMIRHNYNGLLYKNKDISNLAKQIKYLIDNKEKAINLGKTARMDVENKYGTIVIEKYTALINSL